MSAPLERAIEQLWPLDRWRTERVLVAVSGGADSVALLRALVTLTESPQRLVVAHFNHRWRGAASDGDEHFVSQLCEDLGVAVRVGRANSTAPANPTDRKSEERKSEERARDARYQFLIEAAYQCGARYICTAHTASDRVETLLHNLFRGTGLAGVCAPGFKRPLHDELLLVRPLLASYRDDVLAYLSGLGQSYRTDASNQDESYKRNWIRQRLLPMIREAYGDQVDQRIASFSTIAEETVAWQRTAAGDYLERVEALLAEAFRSGQLQGALPQPRELSTDAGALQQSDALQQSGALQQDTTHLRRWLAIPTYALYPQAWPVVQQALALAWSTQGWPLQAMTRGHWQLIRNLWQTDKADYDDQDVRWTRDGERQHVETSSASRIQLPHHLVAQPTGNWIVVRPFFDDSRPNP